MFQKVRNKSHEKKLFLNINTKLLQSKFTSKVIHHQTGLNMAQLYVYIYIHYPMYIYTIYTLKACPVHCHPFIVKHVFPVCRMHCDNTLKQCSLCPTREVLNATVKMNYSLIQLSKSCDHPIQVYTVLQRNKNSGRC